MTQMGWPEAFVLGVVQGLSEFIPVSSTAHLRIVPALLGWDDPGAAFSAVIQLGTLLAVLVYFAADVRRLTWAALRSLFSAEARALPDARLAWGIAAGNVPIVVCGLLLREFIENSARSLYLIAAMLILVALALAWKDRPGAPGGSRAVAQLSVRQILVIGAFQALALLPGASRSGVTILGGLWLGLGRAEAARFSFLLGIPAILGSGLFQLPPLLADGGGTGMSLWVGLAAAALSGFASIAFLLHYLGTHSTRAFVVYRVMLGAGLLLLAGGGFIR